MIIRNLIFIFLLLITTNVYALEKCQWNNKKGIPCLTVTKTPNTSSYSSKGVNKIIITKQDIINSGAVDVKSVLDIVPGLDLKQNGQSGQLTSLFIRGSNSNHTLVLLNGIAINDQSTTQGLHNFGQDFIQTIQQIEIYKGASGAHFGPSAIGGAINFITDVDYTNSLSVKGNFNTSVLNSNFSMITDNGWHLNFKGSQTESETKSARSKGIEKDGVLNRQLNLNTKKWLNNNLKFRSTIYARQTNADYDGSDTNEEGYTAEDQMYAIQSGFDFKKDNKEDSITFHYNGYDREYNENGVYLDNYYSKSFVAKGERKVNYSEKLSYGVGSEYKYDSGRFSDFGSFYPNSTVDAYVYDFGIFGNVGYKVNDSTTFSAFVRSDDHKTTDLNNTYKLNINTSYKMFDFNISQSTGLRNPSLYELYGSNGRTDSYKHVANPNANPEKSSTNEYSIGYKFSDRLYLSMTGYRTSITDALLYNSAYNGGSGYTNTKSDLKQKGLESNIIFGDKNQKLTFYSTISSSKKIDGTHQLNRPNSTHGINYFKKIYTKGFLGSFDLNYDYKHYGKAFDYVNYVISKVDSTDIMNVVLSKDISDYNFSFAVTNLLDESYERPVGYAANGRQINFGFKRSY
jgi:vitamin B12 transporter